MTVLLSWRVSGAVMGCNHSGNKDKKKKIEEMTGEEMRKKLANGKRKRENMKRRGECSEWRRHNG